MYIMYDRIRDIDLNVVKKWIIFGIWFKFYVYCYKIYL